LPAATHYLSLAAGSLVPEVAPDQLGRLLLVGPEQVDDAVSKAEGRGREEDCEQDERRKHQDARGPEQRT